MAQKRRSRAKEADELTGGQTPDAAPEVDDVSPPAPVPPDGLESAPLEPVTRHKPEEPAPPTVADVGVSLAAKGEELFDEATGEAPDPEAVFKPLNEYSSAQVCQVRLMERVYIGMHRRPITRLVIAQGTVVSQAQAEQVKDRLRRQAAR